MAAPPDDSRRAALELLCLRCQCGERDAWTALVSEFERPLYYYLRRLTRSEEEALGVLQETWVQVFSGLLALKDRTRLAPWLYTVARRAAQRTYGQRRNAHDEVADVDAEADPSPDFAADLADVEALHLGLDQLPPTQREVLTLFFLDDLSLREVAEVMDVPLGTVKSRLHTARRSLGAILEPSYQENNERSHARDL